MSLLNRCDLPRNFYRVSVWSHWDRTERTNKIMHGLWETIAVLCSKINVSNKGAWHIT